MGLPGRKWEDRSREDGPIVTEVEGAEVASAENPDRALAEIFAVTRSIAVVGIKDRPDYG